MLFIYDSSLSVASTELRQQIENPSSLAAWHLCDNKEKIQINNYKSSNSWKVELHYYNYSRVEIWNIKFLLQDYYNGHQWLVHFNRKGFYVTSAHVC